ncbi:MAG: hypothetical protein IJF03_02585 [Lachnospiraceae bacterium]|nr:hypothetical protein [Lachnospiraceae bacterium]
MKNVKKVLAGVVVIAGVLAVEIIVQNVVSFAIPETAFATSGAMVGIAVYQNIAKKIDAKEK